MKQFTELERFMIKNRGMMIMVPPIDVPSQELVGELVDIEGTIYKVVGADNCLVNHHKIVDGHFVPTGCWKPVGLLVKAVEQEYSGDG